DSLDDFLADRRPGALGLEEEPPLFEEQCLHWWSNECPLFVVERCCASIPVAKDPDSPERFDGTLRVAFALHRPKAVSKHQEEHQVKPFEIDWLGGYWKLPKTAVSDGQAENLEDIHNRIVSSFNSVDKRTAPLPEEQLQEVYDALTPALPRIFSSGTISVQMIMNVYRQDELFCAFALARVAAAMRVDHLERALGLFDLAKRKVKVPSQHTAEFLPEISVLSYIDRNVGVCSVPPLL
ncbi:dnc, partial [Symbiodinium pilosum]